jgi:hypothetical protein
MEGAMVFINNVNKFLSLATNFWNHNMLLGDEAIV